MHLINKKWFFDTLYNRFLVYPILNFGYIVSFKILDRGFIELAGPFGLSKLALNWSFLTFAIQTGQITHYIFYIVGGICFLFFGILVNDLFLKDNFHLIVFYFSLIFFI